MMDESRNASRLIRSKMRFTRLIRFSKVFSMTSKYFSAEYPLNEWKFTRKKRSYIWQLQWQNSQGHIQGLLWGIWTDIIYYRLCNRTNDFQEIPHTARFDRCCSPLLPFLGTHLLPQTFMQLFLVKGPGGSTFHPRNSWNAQWCTPYMLLIVQRRELHVRIN